jgi:hypothetical protein
MTQRRLCIAAWGLLNMFAAMCALLLSLLSWGTKFSSIIGVPSAEGGIAPVEHMLCVEAVPDSGHAGAVACCMAVAAGISCMSVALYKSSRH